MSEGRHKNIHLSIYFIFSLHLNHRWIINTWLVVRMNRALIHSHCVSTCLYVRVGRCCVCVSLFLGIFLTCHHLVLWWGGKNHHIRLPWQLLKAKNSTILNVKKSKFTKGGKQTCVRNMLQQIWAIIFPNTKQTNKIK